MSTSLKLIAKGIGTSLTKRPDLRLYLLAGLRNLTSKTTNGKFRYRIKEILIICFNRN